MDRQHVTAVPFTRRGLLRTAGAAVATGGIVTACDSMSTAPEGTKKTRTAVPDKRNGPQAPALARRAKHGDLPPVAQRLPDQPLTVRAADRVGTYGGTWRAAMLGPSDDSWLDRACGYEYLLRWKPDTVAHSLDDITPNIASSYEISDDGRRYTFRLRPGMRWSDGQPFGADDVVFAVNDVFLNTDLYPVAPLGLLSGEDSATVSKLGDHTVRFTFEKPNSLFPLMVASKNSGIKQLAAMPRHYLKQFHAKHNPNVADLAKEQKVSDWIQLFLGKIDFWSNPDLPRLHPWLPTASLNKGTTFTLERNPYYWKVDRNGSQLPYIDTFRNDLISNPETMLLKATHGDIDMYDRLINTLQNKPVLARSRSKGNYDFFDLRSGNMNCAIISLNLTHKDRAKREVFQNKLFRVGLSHAINRQEIIKTVYKSLADPYQAAPLPGSPYYDKALAKQYTEYDPAKADQLLDGAGYHRRGSDGPRLGPDGSPISITLEVATRDYGLDWVPAMEMVKHYWAKVGVAMNIRSEDVSLFYNRKDANLHDAAIWLGDVGGLDPHLDPRYLFPHNHESNFAELWQQWYQTFGKEGERPPAAPRRQMRLYDEFKVTMDRERQRTLMRQIAQLAREQFYTIGLCRPKGRYGIATNGMHNVMNNYLEASNYPNPGPTNPEQYSLS